jgi:cyclic pyranopterin phosphate synthase
VLAGVNDDEIPDFARFADRPGMQVRFIEYMPLGGDDWEERFLPAAVMERRLLAAVDAVPVPDPGSGAARRMFRLEGGGMAGFISPISEPFCGSCDRIRLTSAGTIRACLIADGTVDVRSLVRSGAPDEALVKAILEAFGMKPEGGHGIAAGFHPVRRDCADSMRGIGG